MKLRLPPSSAQSLVRKLITAGLDAADPYRALLDRSRLMATHCKWEEEFTTFHRLIE
ncbi:MAG: hypothetical protein HC801_05230 [Nitrospira sp.]|nr:hypothetical protein [Nitrospira sp.]